MSQVVLFRSGNPQDFAWFRVGADYDAVGAARKQKELESRGFFSVVVDGREFNGVPKTYEAICPRCEGTGIYDVLGHDRDCKQCRGRGVLSSAKPSRRSSHRSVVIPASVIANLPVQPVQLPPVVVAQPTCPCCRQPAEDLFDVIDESGTKRSKDPVCQQCGEKFIAYYQNSKAPSARNTQGL